MRRIILWLAYDGTAYCGFQTQPNGVAVAAVLDAALTKLAGHPVRVLGASRTDSGVHARAQAASFDLDSAIPTAAIPAALRGLLPDDVVVYAAAEVAADFAIIREAAGKHYRYSVRCGGFADPFDRRYVYHVDYVPQLAPMCEAARLLEGEHDFRAFTAAHSGRENFVRRLDRITVTTEGDLLYFDFWGRGFLYKMVRGLTGFLLDCGRGRFAPPHGSAVLQSGERSALGLCAPAHGLCLERVYFEENEYLAALPKSVL